jgi:hypothetical protein
MTVPVDPDQPAGRDPLVDRARVVQVLQRVGLSPDKIDALLEGVEFPDRVSHLEGRLVHIGITKDRLMDRMGGSP